MLSLETVVARSRVEKEYEWGKWCKEIPALQFKSDWNVQLIPPFGGAIVRYLVSKGDRQVSVYLDCYNELGLYGVVDGKPVPYWEVYPYSCDTFRCDMNDTEELLKRIDEALNGNDEQSNERENKIEAKWSGKYPCLCCGEWTLIFNGVDISDKIPKELRNEPMDTYGEYESWHFDSNYMEVFTTYKDGSKCEDWIHENKEWLDTISTDISIQKDIYNAFSKEDFREGSCGGCI